MTKEMKRMAVLRSMRHEEAVEEVDGDVFWKRSALRNISASCPKYTNDSTADATEYYNMPFMLLSY